jgi:hypothetical protein
MMQSNGGRVAIVLAAIAVIVVLFVVTSGSDDSNDTTTDTPTATTGSDTGGGSGGSGASAEADVPVIKVVDGQPDGGVQELDYNKGDEVNFIVRSDTADEVHVHGYDLMQDVEAGGKVEFDFPADIEGIFEVELETTATQLIELRVNP